MKETVSGRVTMKDPFPHLLTFISIPFGLRNVWLLPGLMILSEFSSALAQDPSIMIKFEYPRYVAVEGNPPEMKIVMDGDLIRDGNQSLESGLGSFALKCQYAPADALINNAQLIEVQPPLNNHEDGPASIVVLPGFFSITGNVDSSTNTGAMDPVLATIRFDNIPNKDVVYQFSLESGSPSEEMSVFTDGADNPIDSEIDFGTAKLTAISSQELEAAVSMDDQSFLPTITFNRRLGWDYYVDGTSNPSVEASWTTLPTPGLATTMIETVAPLSTGLLVDTLATQSTIRRFYRVRINPQVSLRFYDLEVPENTSLVDYLNLSIDALAPAVPTTTDKAIFESYSSTSASTWANNWTAALDFSGIAWDNNRAGTLISEQHFIYARHFARDDGDTVRFTDRNGDIVERTIESQGFARFDAFPEVVSTDIQIARLNEPLPDTVTYYSLFPEVEDPSSLLGAKVLFTNQHRNLAMAKISQIDLFEHNSVPDTEVVTTQPDGSLIDPAWAYELIVGDSGHPMFFVIEGQLVLVSHHTWTGDAKGPYYGGPGNHVKMQRIMDEL